MKDTITASLTVEVTRGRNLHTIDLVNFHDLELGVCVCVCCSSDHIAVNALSMLLYQANLFCASLTK